MSGVGRNGYGRLSEGASKPPLMKEREGQQAKVYTPEASRPTFPSPPETQLWGGPNRQRGGDQPS